MSNSESFPCSNLGIASMSDYGGSVNGLSMLGVDGLIEKRRAVLNLYLLSNVSPMLMLIRSAWSNYLLVRPYFFNTWFTDFFFKKFRSNEGIK